MKNFKIMHRYRYKIKIEYDGTQFHGWQRQSGYDTIQQKIEDSMIPFLKKRVPIHGSGRTDAGVHAICQVAHFDFNEEINCFRLQECMNFHLYDVPIGILTLEKTSLDFNSRLSAIERSYEYRIMNRRTKPCIDVNKVWHISYPLDEIQMHLAAQYLIGKHDFSSFRAAGCQSKSPIKTVNSISIARKNDLITARVSAKSFLYHQVRNIVGSLIMVGSGKWPPEYIDKILQAKDRTIAGPTAPSHGLFFLETKYDIA